MAASVTLTACGGGGGVAGISTASSDFLAASQTTEARAAIRVAIKDATQRLPLFGSVTQSTFDTDTSTVGLLRENGKLRYHTISARNPLGLGYDATKPSKAEGDRFSRVDLFLSGKKANSAVNVFTDYELPTPTVFSNGEAIPGDYSALTTADAGTHENTYTLNGVVGIMSCEGECILTNGNVGGSGKYTFTPNISLENGNVDTDYLVGGIWIWIPNEATRANPDLDSSDTSTWIGVSVNGNDPFGDMNGMGIAAVTGSATYEGGARGLVTGKDDEGNIAFKANVELRAEFGNVLVGGMISGTVSDFTDAGTGDIIGDSGDTVILGVTAIGTDRSGFFTGDTTVTSVDPTETLVGVGKWGGQFYGNSADAQPGSVAGTFGNSDDDLSYLGIFGAYKN